MTRFAESDVEEAALEYLERFGYGVVAGPEIAPGSEAPERGSYAGVLLENRVRGALSRLNPRIPAEALADAYRRLAHLPISRVFAVIFLAIGIGYIGLGLAGNYRVGLPFAIIAQFGNGLTIPALIAWALTKYSLEFRGRGMGLWGGCFFVGQWLSPLAVSLVGLFTAGFMQTVVVFGAACIGVAAIAALVRSEPLAVAGSH